MTFFSMFGWVVLFIMALCGTIGIPALIIMLSEFGGGRGKWIAWIFLGIGSSAIYSLLTNAPFHIALG